MYIALIIIIALLVLLIVAVAVVKYAFDVVGLWNAVHLTGLLIWDLLATCFTYWN